MVWLILGGICAILIVSVVCIWAVIALLAEVGEEQDSATDAPESDPPTERKRVRSRAIRN